MLKYKSIPAGLIALAIQACYMPSSLGQPAPDKKQVEIGAYYFDGWAGRNRHADNPDEPWAKNAPTHLTRRFVEEFSEREPVWGWRDDDLEIMEKQIDLAADNGISFFLFCWYWRDNKGTINPEAIGALPHHTSLNLYMKARNKHRIKFGLLVANHTGSEIIGPENWGEAVKYWLPYFNDPQHITVEGKPLVVLFDSKGIDEEGLARMQQAARAGGIDGIAIAGCGSASPKGFTHRTHYNIIPGYAAGSEAHPYSELVAAHLKNWSGSGEKPYIPEVTVGWDKRPWEGASGLNQKPGWYFPERTVDQFKDFLKKAITWMDEHPEETTRERIVLLYAWNELGEGGYLVPTKGDPEAKYLKAVKEVIGKK
ncbi:MAG: hypothetical protein ABS46_03225 [Cytophagaceae bacterium SCN 52-12]|nr:MAG: hypothetical protein ABS46_03225 [Cytophagaceae bacterium SCN 52-12]